MKENKTLSPKLVKRFYEALVLLRVLGQVQGDKLHGESFEEGNINEMNLKDLRRKVMYHLCVICDFEKGGDTVTAIACEDVPSGPRYWMAANGHVEKIKPFLMEVLRMLEAQTVIKKKKAPIATLESKLFEKFVEFQPTRIKGYWKMLQKPVTAERQRALLSPERHDDTNEYIKWLARLQQPPMDTNSHCDLSQFAYDTRHSIYVRTGYDPITGQSTMMENDFRADIRHLVGRLGAPRRAAAFLAEAVQSSPVLFSEFTVKTVPRQPAAITFERPAVNSKLTLDGIVGRMFSNSPDDTNHFRKALHSLDEKGSIMLRILDQYRDKNWQVRVHAELALLEALHSRNCAFYDGDKYIACSKPACFCCYHYICAHPGLFTRPPCHNKLYLNWCPPSLGAIEGISANQQRDIMNELAKHTKSAAIRKVFDAERGSRWHPDSSTGITPSVAHATALDLYKQRDRESAVLVSSCNSQQGQDSRSETELSLSDDDDDDGGVRLEQYQ